VSFLAVCSSAAHPFGTPKRFDARRPAVEDLKIPPEVAALLRRSCTDCHSNQTVWPWYSYVAPVSWLVEKDVHAGRERLNLSEWRQYTFKQREKLLADVATVVKNREMPLPQYLAVHRHAGLSDAETDILYGWARTERRKLRSAQ
jgi:Haem-binding domain